MSQPCNHHAPPTAAVFDKRPPSPRARGGRGARRRGVAAVTAMLFLVIISTLAVAVYAMATTSVHSARNYSDANRARATAESGLRWMGWRFTRMSRPKTTVGNITSTVAASLWPGIGTSLTNDLATMLTPAERVVSYDGTTFSTASIACDESEARFVVSIRPHPLDVGDPLDGRFLRVSSTGMYRGARQTVAMDFQIDKKVRFAIVGKVPIQIGRNTIVEGPIGMGTANKYPPIYMLSDFRHLKTALTSQIDAFNTFLAQNHNGYDNRININNPVELQKAIDAGYTDYSEDGFIDEYDLFLQQFDSNRDKAISTAEFTNPATGEMYDPDLFAAIDGLGGPLYEGDPQRAGYQDSVIDKRDGYTKVRGTISMAVTANAWTSNLAGQGLTITDMIRGPIQPSNGAQLPIVFGADSSQIFDLAPSNFDTTGFRLRTGPENGASSGSGGTLTNRVLSASDANDGTADERTPLGSTSYQATYRRPVFRNMTFNNCRIPKGLNAVFDNCTFNGVTYVDLETNITKSNGVTTTSASDGMTWSKRMKSGSFNKNTALTSSNSYGFTDGNNLRFNNCVMHGPVAASNPTAYTHFSNSWEFTGATLFDNQADQTATLMCPQTNVEMGSFTDPAAAPSTLIGVCVAGNIDVRGKSVVDGSIIITGDGAGNTTQGWFGPSDANTDPSSPMPEGGYGRLSIRYNPYRALPDGINVAIDILPDPTTYRRPAMTPRIVSRSARRARTVRRARRGIGMIELLIALSITATLLAATAMAVDAAFRGFQINQENAILMQRARVALHFTTTSIRTTQQHAPYASSASAAFTAGATVTDSGLRMYDAQDQLIAFYHDPTTEELRVTSGGATHVLAHGVSSFQVRLEPMRSTTSIKTGGGYDLLKRATIILTVRTPPGAAVAGESTGRQTITLSASVMPRRNVW